MKELIKAALDDSDFFRLIGFNTRYCGKVLMIVPVAQANQYEELISEGCSNYYEYEAAFKVSDLMNNDRYFPFVYANEITYLQAMEQLEQKLQDLANPANEKHFLMDGVVSPKDFKRYLMRYINQFMDHHFNFTDKCGNTGKLNRLPLSEAKLIYPDTFHPKM